MRSSVDRNCFAKPEMMRSNWVFSGWSESSGTSTGLASVNRAVRRAQRLANQPDSSSSDPSAVEVPKEAKG